MDQTNITRSDPPDRNKVYNEAFVFPTGSAKLQPTNAIWYKCAACHFHPGVDKIHATWNVSSMSHHVGLKAEMEELGLRPGDAEFKGPKNGKDLCPGALPLEDLMKHDNCNKEWFEKTFGKDYKQKINKVREMATFMDPRFEIFPDIQYPHKAANWKELAEDHENNPSKWEYEDVEEEVKKMQGELEEKQRRAKELKEKAQAEQKNYSTRKAIEDGDGTSEVSGGESEGSGGSQGDPKKKTTKKKRKKKAPEASGSFNWRHSTGVKTGTTKKTSTIAKSRKRRAGSEQGMDETLPDKRSRKAPARLGD